MQLDVLKQPTQKDKHNLRINGISTAVIVILGILTASKHN